MNNNPIYKKTLKKPVSFVGRGLHSGAQATLTLKPCKDSSGIFFRRKDVAHGKGMIAARWYKVTDTTLSTVITNRFGVSVATVEHLMAALKICGIDNLEIEIDGPEVPIMDGSAQPFVETILHTGTQTFYERKRAIWIKKTITVTDGDKYAIFLPDLTPRITVSIDFKEEAIGAQTYSTDLNAEILRKEIAPARTFGFADQIEKLRINGLARGGSLQNAILVDGMRILNKEGLRFDNEFVRHKVLDTIGDLALVGVPIIGHYYSYKGGHQLNKMLIKKMLSDKSLWSYVYQDEFQQLHGGDEQDAENEYQVMDINVELARESAGG